VIPVPTSFVAIDADIFRFATSLASCARIFTSAQLARHSLFSMSQPQKRAAEWLHSHPEAFEHIRGIHPYLHLWRLTEAYKRAHGLRYRNVGASQRTAHWLSFGDLYMNLVFNGVRPEKWFTEGRKIGGFDLYIQVNGISHLVEVQNTPLSERQWHAKWKQRDEWLTAQKWRPRVILVTTKPMKIHKPEWVQAVDITQAHKVIGR
jgi:hypothetical protein